MITQETCENMKLYFSYENTSSLGILRGTEPSASSSAFREKREKRGNYFSFHICILKLFK